MYQRERLGEKVRCLRESSGLTQKELGEKTDVGGSTISALERGNKQPSLELLYKICVNLNVSADYLLNLAPEHLDTEMELRGLSDPQISVFLHLMGMVEQYNVLKEQLDEQSKDSGGACQYKKKR